MTALPCVRARLRSKCAHGERAAFVSQLSVRAHAVCANGDNTAVIGRANKLFERKTEV
jgi:hypothetical protein